MSSKININYQIIMYTFQIETSFVNLNPLARNPVSAPASTIYFILFTWASPYGTHKEPSCTAHMGAQMGPIWLPYRLLAGCSIKAWMAYTGFYSAPFHIMCYTMQKLYICVLCQALYPVKNETLCKQFFILKHLYLMIK